MNEAKGNLTYHIDQVSKEFSKKAAIGNWLKEHKKAAYDAFKRSGLPTPKKEEWKYFDFKSVLAKEFDEPDHATEKESTLEQAPGLLAEDKNRIEKLAGKTVKSRLKNSHHLQLINGQVNHQSITEDLREEASVLSYEKLPKTQWESVRQLLNIQADEPNPLYLFNTFQFQDSLVVTIPKNTALSKPLHIQLATLAELSSPLVNSRVLIVIEEGSNATLYMDSVIKGDNAYFHNYVVEVVLGKNASCDMTFSMPNNKNGFTFSDTRFFVNESARLNFTNLVINGQKTRHQLTVESLGEQTDIQLSGLTLLTGHSEAYTHTMVRHVAPKGTCRQVFKNILSGKAKAEFNGGVFVAKDAQLTDSSQSSKSLVLSDDARSLARPQLEIYADDVQCAHGATIGQLNEDELLYCQSRGLTKNQAARLLVDGFAYDILEKIQDADIKVDLERYVKSALNALGELDTLAASK